MIDYAMLIKLYGEPTVATNSELKYSPGDCTGFEKKRILGKPKQNTFQPLMLSVKT